MEKDWTGNSNSVFRNLSASNHSADARQSDDYYATDPKALEKLLEKESFNHYVWECACGGGHLVDVLKHHGYDVICSDIVNRGCDGARIIDFLNYTRGFAAMDRDIITNPLV